MMEAEPRIAVGDRVRVRPGPVANKRDLVWYGRRDGTVESIDDHPSWSEPMVVVRFDGRQWPARFAEDQLVRIASARPAGTGGEGA